MRVPLTTELWIYEILGDSSDIVRPSHNGLVLLQACSAKKYAEQELFVSKRGLCFVLEV
jgi:hypothetical protein